MAGSNSIQELYRQLENVIKQHPSPHSAAPPSQGPSAGSPQGCGQQSCRSFAPPEKTKAGRLGTSPSAQGGPQGDDTLDPSPSACASALLGAAAGAAAGGLQPEAPEYTGAGEGTQAVPSGSCSGHRNRAAPGVLLMSPGRRAAEGIGGVCAETRLPTHRLPGRCPRRFSRAVEEAREDGERRACACRMCCLTLHG